MLRRLSVLMLMVMAGAPAAATERSPSDDLLYSVLLFQSYLGQRVPNASVAHVAGEIDAKARYARLKGQLPEGIEGDARLLATVWSRTQAVSEGHCMGRNGYDLKKGFGCETLLRELYALAKVNDPLPAPDLGDTGVVSGNAALRPLYASMSEMVGRIATNLAPR